MTLKLLKDDTLLVGRGTLMIVEFIVLLITGACYGILFLTGRIKDQNK